MSARKKYISIIILVLFVIPVINVNGYEGDIKEPVDYVNPFVGTDFFAHTFPGACLPFAMVRLSPVIDITGWDYNAGYHYSGNSIMGFSHLHRGGDMFMMPTIGDAIEIEPGSRENPDKGYRSRFSHDEEDASAGYYMVNLKDYNIKAELTVTKRAGFHRYTFPKAKNAHILINLGYGRGNIDRIIEQAKKRGISEDIVRSRFALDAHIEIVSDTQIEGFRRSRGYAVFFAAEFNRPFMSYGTWDRRTYPYKNSETGSNIGAFVNYSTTENEQILVKVGISFVSIEGARKNLETEIPYWAFERVRESAREIWNKELSKIKVIGGTEDQYVTFYSALYRSLLSQYISSDVNGKYPGMDYEIHVTEDYDFFPDFLCWDTFRTLHPLLTLIEAKRVPGILKSIVSKYTNYGWLPAQHTRNVFRQGMIGDHLVPIIADAYMKGIKDFNAEKAYEAMRRKALELPPSPHDPAEARSGLNYYMDLGYIPADKVTESVSNTLEFCYDDWCIAQVAKVMSKEEDYKLFMKRAHYYENLYDPSTKFMRPKKVDGSWLELCVKLPEEITDGDHRYYSCFDPLFVGSRPRRHYTESNAWQYLWFVPHDVQGLVNLLGGNEGFIQRLDSCFTMSPEITGPKYIGVVGTIGQYVHGNQPSHHMGYLYNYVGQPWKTQQRVRKVMDRFYGPGPDGLCGNEDRGSMSSWYVFSALGFYPVCPGQNVYVIGTPLFEEARINLGEWYDGKEFIIKANDVSAENIYIQSASLNGEPLNKTWITHTDIVDGGTLIFQMGPEPNIQWGVSPDAAPPSMSR